MAYQPTITSGAQAVPDLMLIYGTAGVGKSTFGSLAPKPLFFDLEHGTRRLDVKRIIDFPSLDDFWEKLNWFWAEDHGYETLVIDSVSELETLIFKQVCADDGANKIEDVGGGFQKGYVNALNYWGMFRESIRKIQAKKRTNVIMIGHEAVKTFTDPLNNSAYDRYQIKLDNRGAAFLRQWVDFIGFANFEITVKGKESAAKQKATGTDKRWLYTGRRPGWDAKNRLGLPLKIEFDYGVYAKAAHASETDKAVAIRAAIEVMLADTTDQALKDKVRNTVAKAGDAVTSLTLIQERLSQRIEEKEIENGGAK